MSYGQLPGAVRGMRAGDYRGLGASVIDQTPAAADGSNCAAGPTAVLSSGHPLQDVFIGAAIGAAALWIVPKLLDWAVETTMGARDHQLEEEDFDE
jgi:hypothetical protein